MIKKIALQIILLTVISKFALGQDNVAGIYVDSLGQVYVQANMPAYFFLAPDDKKESRVLITSKDPKSNPMYFDGNGIHYIKTLDAETNKMVSFKIIADGIAPKVSIHFKEGLYMKSPKKYIIEEGSKAEVVAKDNLSGVRAIYVSIDNSNFVNTNTILFGNGADYHVRAFAIDNVGNISDTLEFRALTSINSIVKLNNIYYDTNSSKLRPESKIELNELAQVLAEFPKVRIELRAHTDCRGDAVYNLILSEKRAEAVANYLVYKGIDRNRLTSKGFGDTSPINECVKGIICPEEKHQENRRVEFKILPIK
ncbi:MAG: OmpA family protein [Bacteroidales bacterium]|nr:OmpA family protein [Bacteroidales bacterium]